MNLNSELNFIILKIVCILQNESNLTHERCSRERVKKCQRTHLPLCIMVCRSGTYSSAHKGLWPPPKQSPSVLLSSTTLLHLLAPRPLCPGRRSKNLDRGLGSAVSRISVSQISLLPTVSSVGSVLKMDMCGLVLFLRKKQSHERRLVCAS